MSIADYGSLSNQKRLEQRQFNQHKILSFLAQERSVTIDSLSRLFDFSANQKIYLLLKNLINNELVTYFEDGFLGRTKRFYHLTAQGQAFAEQELGITPRFNGLSRRAHAPSALLHTLEMQNYTALLMKAGAKVRYLHLPDKIMDYWYGGTAAEVERTFKSQKRYRDIFRNYCLRMRRNDPIINTVMYILPDSAMRDKAAALFYSFDELMIEGILTDVRTYTGRFLFATRAEYEAYLTAFPQSGVRVEMKLPNEVWQRWQRHAAQDQLTPEAWLTGILNREVPVVINEPMPYSGDGVLINLTPTKDDYKFWLANADACHTSLSVWCAGKPVHLNL
ncbi:TPA: hypothetical protein ON641_002667 [Proteus mirabilis]|nr:hypothetical protein [Proteus mirabilis]